MKIVVIGGGKVGATICRELSDSFDIVLVDKNPEVVEDIFSNYDIQAIVGNGASVEVQREAEISTADLTLAVTNSDELNIMACIIAGRLGAKHTIARVRNPEYHRSVDFIKTSLGIYAMINPEEEAAKVIARLLRMPMAHNIELFADKRVSMVELEIKEKSPLNNMSLKSFRDSFEGHVLVCVVERGSEVFIPYGDTVIKAGDKIYVTGSIEDVESFYRVINEFKAPIKSVMIVGGGRISYYLIDRLLKKGFNVKVIENNRATAEDLSLKFPKARVIHADGSSQSVLEEEGIAGYDACIALTGIDEENIFISLFAKHKNVRKCITKVNRTAMLKILAHVDLDSIITPGSIIADEIVGFARGMSNYGSSNIQCFHKLADRQVDAIEFKAAAGSRTLNIPLADLKTKDNTLVSLIVRNNEPILPKGDDVILEGDTVVIVTKHQNISGLDGILAK